MSQVFGPDTCFIPHSEEIMFNSNGHLLHAAGPDQSSQGAA